MGHMKYDTLNYQLHIAELLEYSEEIDSSLNALNAGIRSLLSGMPFTQAKEVIDETTRVERGVHN